MFASRLWLSHKLDWSDAGTPLHVLGSADALESLGCIDHKTQLALGAFGTGATHSSGVELGLNTYSRDRRPLWILDFGSRCLAFAKTKRRV